LTPASTNLDSPSTPQPVENPAEMPVWLRRLFLVVYVVFCIELGIVLFLLPGSNLWFNNNLLAHWPTLRHFVQHGFVRGAIRGLGLLDLWIGISEAVHYRDRR
jgi:hypothetical protein